MTGKSPGHPSSDVFGSTEPSNESWTVEGAAPVGDRNEHSEATHKPSTATRDEVVYLRRVCGRHARGLVCPCLSSP